MAALSVAFVKSSVRLSDGTENGRISFATFSVTFYTILTVQQQYRVGVLKNVVKLGHSDSEELKRLAVGFIFGNLYGHLENDIIAWF